MDGWTHETYAHKLEAENAKLRAEVEVLKCKIAARDCIAGGYEKKWKDAELQIGELKNTLHTARELANTIHRSVAECGCDPTVDSLCEFGQIERAFDRDAKKPKCGLVKPLSGDETCVLDVGHRGPCDHALKRKDVWTEEELRQLDKEAERLSKALDLPKPEKRKCDMTGPCEDGHVCDVNRKDACGAEFLTAYSEIIRCERANGHDLGHVGVVSGFRYEWA